MISALDVIENVSADVQAEHRSFQMLLKMLFAEHLDAADSTSPRIQREFAHEVNNGTLEVIRRPKMSTALVDAVDSMVAMAISDCGLDVNDETLILISELNSQNLENTLQSLHDIFAADQSTVMHANRKLQLQAGLKAAAGINIRIAMNMVKAGSVNALHFGKRDRSGAIWNATILSKTLVRSMLVSSYCEAFLMALLSNGITEASITNDAGEKQTFSILGEDGAIYEAIKEKYLHPNASRLVQLP